MLIDLELSKQNCWVFLTCVCQDKNRTKQNKTQKVTEEIETLYNSDLACNQRYPEVKQTSKSTQLRNELLQV